MDTASAVLIVQGKPPQITPISSNLCFGSHTLETTLTKKAHINCVASGRPLPNITWYMMSQVRKMNFFVIEGFYEFNLPLANIRYRASYLHILP